MLELVRSIGETFTHEQYLFWSRVEGTLWTAADVVIVIYLLRITNLLRGRLDLRLHRFSYVVLGLTLPFCAAIPMITDARWFFYIELIVTIPHFLLILYLCLGDARHALRALSSRGSARYEGG